MSRDDRPETIPFRETAAFRDGNEPEKPETVALTATQPLGNDAADAAGDSTPRWRLIPWGLAVGSGLLVSALLAMTGRYFLEQSLTLGLWYHWLGVAGLGLVAAAVLGFVVREAAALVRLKRLGALQARAQAALEAEPAMAEGTIGALEDLYAGRADLEWPLAGFREHRQAYVDAGDLLGLFETQVLRPLDAQAAQAIAQAARRTTAATAISPFAWLDMAATFTINLALLGRIARLYGGRPGRIASLRLLRLSFANVLAAGAIELADDTFGDLLGASFAARLSARAGSGVLNGLLTARLGLATVDLCRPLPWRMASRPSPRGLMKRALVDLKASEV